MTASAEVSMPSLSGVAHKEVDVNGVVLHVAEAGSGPPLVLVHGWPQHWWCWRHLIRSLARTYRVLAPDLRGFGWSDAPQGNYAKSTFAADILGLLDAEGIDRVRLVGHDWGGYAAFLVALEHPDRVERLLALDIPPPWFPARLPSPRHLALPLLASYQLALATPLLGARLLTSGPWAVRAIIRGGSGPLACWPDNELDVYANVLSEPARAAASSACYRTFLARELPAAALGGDRGGELQVPSLLAMGENSGIRRVFDPQPGHNLRVETVRRAGHFLPEEAPAEVIALVRGWLED